jgi:hypothetical protein
MPIRLGQAAGGLSWSAAATFVRGLPPRPARARHVARIAAMMCSSRATATINAAGRASRPVGATDRLPDGGCRVSHEEAGIHPVLPDHGTLFTHLIVGMRSSLD